MYLSPRLKKNNGKIVTIPVKIKHYVVFLKIILKNNISKNLYKLNKVKRN